MHLEFLLRQCLRVHRRSLATPRRWGIHGELCVSISWKERGSICRRRCIGSRRGRTRRESTWRSPSPFCTGRTARMRASSPASSNPSRRVLWGSHLLRFPACQPWTTSSPLDLSAEAPNANKQRGRQWTLRQAWYLRYQIILCFSSVVSVIGGRRHGICGKQHGL